MMRKPMTDGPYAVTLREMIAKGEISLDQAFKFLLDHGCHPRIATRLLNEHIYQELGA